MLSHNLMGYPYSPKMITSAIFLHLLLLSHQTGELTASEKQVLYVTGEKGGNTTLQCLDHQVNVSLHLYRWKKNGAVVATQNPSKPSQHLSISNNGSLWISGLQFIDEGQYECESQTKNGTSWQTLSNTLLRVAEGVSLAIYPAALLQNGTLYVKKGSDVYFNCSSEASSSQNLTWTVTDLAQDSYNRVSGNKSFLEFSIKNIQQSDQGMYTCTSQDTLSNTTMHKSQELLVYYAPERHPQCSWEIVNKPLDVLLMCSWYGGYPLPTLDWHEVLKEHVIAKGPTVNSTSLETELLKVHVNGFILHSGDELKCVGHHVTGVENSCSFELKLPYPIGDPMVTALVGSNITLSCTENESLPSAKTVWLQKDKKIINTTSKYIVSDLEPHYKLTIINVTKEDEGIYYCYSINPIGPKELEVYLTVKTSAGNGGALVGVFVSVLIMMIGIIIGVTVYSKRDRICIGLGFSHLDDDRGDILSLVDSDEEEIFHDTVPQLPPLTNGHATTLVEIHRIPSSDQEDNADNTVQHNDQTHPEPAQQTALC